MEASVVSMPWLPYVTTILTVIIGINTAIIAILQWKLARRQYDLNRQKLRMDLFDRRVALYGEVRGFVDEVLRKPDMDDVVSWDHWKKVAHIKYLFDDRAHALLDEVFAMADDLRLTHGLIGELAQQPARPEVTQEREEAESRRRELRRNLRLKIKVIDEVLGEYLRVAVAKV